MDRSTEAPTSRSIRSSYSWRLVAVTDAGDTSVASAPGVGVDRGAQLVGGHDRVEQAHRPGLLGQHHPPRQQQVGGVGDADEAGQHPAHAVLGREPELGRRRRELGAGGGEAEVAEAGQRQADAGAGPVHRGDHREAQPHCQAKSWSSSGRTP